MSLKVQDINTAIVNRYQEEILPSLKEGLEDQQQDSIERLFEDVAFAAHADGKQLIDCIDFNYLFKATCPEIVYKAFESGRMNGQSSDARGLQESVASTIKSSAFDRLMDTCVLQIMQDFSCPESPFTLRDRVTTPLTLDCRQNKYCEWIKPNLPDLCCMKEDEETPYYGLGDMRCWKTPTACKIKFAFGFNREMLCIDPNGTVRNQINGMAQWFDEMDEYAIIKLIFNAEGCGGGGAQNCRFPFIYNDVQYAMYQNAAANAPWTNLYQDAALEFTGCCDSPPRAIEALMEKERDIDTGRPITCLETLQIMIPFWADRYKFTEALGPRIVNSSCTGAGCTQTQETQRAGRDGWDTNLVYSRHTLDILKHYYLNCHGTLAADEDEAEEWAKKTYVVGNFKAALGFATEWGLETLTREGTDTWEYWDREVVYQRKYMRKATPMVLKPWMLKLIKAF